MKELQGKNNQHNFGNSSWRNNKCYDLANQIKDLRFPEKVY